MATGTLNAAQAGSFPGLTAGSFVQVPGLTGAQTLSFSLTGAGTGSINVYVSPDGIQFNQIPSGLILSTAGAYGAPAAQGTFSVQLPYSGTVYIVAASITGSLVVQASLGLPAPPISTGPTTALFTPSLNRVAGAYTVGTVSGGDILIKSVAIFVSTAATGLTSISMATDNGTANTVLGSTLLVALTLGANLTPYATETYLPSGKHLNLTIVGNGSAGALSVAVEYYPLSAGAVIS